MRKIAIYFIFIIVATLFAMTVPSWQVSLKTDGRSASNLAHQLWSGESGTPTSQVNIIQGRNIYRGVCADCHGSGQTEFGIGSGNPAASVRYSPRDIHQIITFGEKQEIPDSVEYTGQPFDLKRDHPAYPAQLTDTERWAVSIYLISATLDPLDFEVDIEWLNEWRKQLHPEDPGRSRVNLFSQNCAICHGPAGYGNGPLAHDLIPSPSSLRDTAWLANQSDWYLYSVIREGRFNYPGVENRGSWLETDNAWTGMPSWDKYLSDGQMIRLVNHIRSFSYALEETVSSVEDYEEIVPDLNRWAWSEISRELPDAPGSPPGWLEE